MRGLFSLTRKMVAEWGSKLKSILTNKRDGDKNFNAVYKQELADLS